MMIDTIVEENTDRYWFACGSWETAMKAAHDLIGLCAEDKVHHTTKRQLSSTRLEPRTTKSYSSTSEGHDTVSVSHSEVQVHDYEQYDEPVYQQGSEQLLWLARDMKQLGVGQCVVCKMGATPHRFTVPLVEDSWFFPEIPEFGIERLSDKKVRECMSLIKAKPEFQAPVAVILPGKKTQTPMERNATKRRGRS